MTRNRSHLARESHHSSSRRRVRASCSAERAVWRRPPPGEPYRIEGKKTMGLELAEQLEWRLPTHVVYPTGGGTGLIGMWKVFGEMRAGGWLNPDVRFPRMIS